MSFTNDNIKKICNFYVSDWHFTVMILPYINSEIDKGAKITTIFETNIEEKIKVLLEKLNLRNKNKILEINWNNKKENNVQNYINKNVDKEEIFIVKGSTNYIEEVNKQINNYVRNKDLKNNIIKIINCYEVSKNEEKMYNIIKMHDTILNTSGEHEIEKIV